MSLFDGLFKKQQKSLASMQENECFPSEPQERKAADSVLESVDGISLLNQHKNGLIDDKAFLHSFGKVKGFYSTPFGDHKDGDSRLFLLPAQDKTAYLPVFSSTERAMEFYEKAGRQGFLIIEGSFTSFFETPKRINQGNTPIKLGAVAYFWSVCDYFCVMTTGDAAGASPRPTQLRRRGRCPHRPAVAGPSRVTTHLQGARRIRRAAKPPTATL